MRDRQAAETVRDEHDGLVGGDDRGVERGHPLLAHGLGPAALLHAPVLGMRALPQRLPVARAGVVVAGQDQYGTGGHALSVPA